jgi:hypothetical protein
MPSLDQAAVCGTCADGLYEVCPVCHKRYPGPLGHACSGPPSGFTSPEVARQAALIFAALGQTGAEILAGKHAGDPLFVLFAELADGVDAVLAGGLTPADCLALLGIPASATAQAAA